MIFKEKCFSRFILLTNKISLSHCLRLFWDFFFEQYVDSIVCFPGCDVINLEIKLIFLIKPFFYMTEKPRQKLKSNHRMKLKFMLKSLFNKVAGLKACNFVKKRLQHRCFPVNIAKCLRTAFFKKHLRWMLLDKY